jgi:hypothetical protein
MYMLLVTVNYREYKEDISPALLALHFAAYRLIPFLQALTIQPLTDTNITLAVDRRKQRKKFGFLEKFYLK